MTVLAALIPISVLLGGLGLAAFTWCLRSGQFDDHFLATGPATGGALHAGLVVTLDIVVSKRQGLATGRASAAPVAFTGI